MHVHTSHCGQSEFTYKEIREWIQTVSIVQVFNWLSKQDTCLIDLAWKIQEGLRRKNKTQFSLFNSFVKCWADDIDRPLYFCPKALVLIECGPNYPEIFQHLRNAVLKPDWIVVEFTYEVTFNKISGPSLPYLAGYVRVVRQRKYGYYKIEYRRHRHLIQADNHARELSPYDIPKPRWGLESCRGLHVPDLQELAWRKARWYLPMMPTPVQEHIAMSRRLFPRDA